MHQAHEVLQMCVDESCKLVLFIDGELEKSNFWTALLIWPVIKSRVVAVVDESSFDDWYDNEADDDKRYFVAHVDDGSFSGQQISQVLTRLGIAKKTASSAGKLVWVFVVAAMSDKARRTILVDGLNSAVFPITSIKLHTFGYIAEEIFKRQHGYAEWQDAYNSFFDAIAAPRYQYVYRVTPDICMAYFDHKLPDRTSTITQIIALAPAFDESNDGHISRRSLIKGCDASNYTVEDEPVDDDSEQFGQFDEDTICPPSFYKYINYEYDGDVIEDVEERGFGAFVRDIEEENE